MLNTSILSLRDIKEEIESNESLIAQTKKHAGAQ